MNKCLDVSFFNHLDVVQIAQDLLYKVVVTEHNGIYTSGLIVETEAYRGPDDKACHAYNNKRSPKNEDMYGAPGTAYVYTCYGMYDLFNVVTAAEGVAHAVLIRGVQPLEGEQTMVARRSVQGKYQITNGPGKLGIALGIKKKWSGSNLMEQRNIWIEDRGITLNKSEIVAGPRVGLTTAEECSNWSWRFQIADSNWVSKPKKVWYPGK